ncbi:MAG TPA: hypothetical protein VLA93_09565 [Pyrinomonadaceae bacterium]|nr:hypothetical protein [Pyrinomonadaceae bacterium]
MSEDRTKDLNEPGSFEERFDRMEIRITNLEDRQYDTKPIWERALTEIAELRSGHHTDIEGLRTDLRSEFQTGIESLRSEIKAESESVRYTLEHELRRFGRQMDVLNQTLLQIQADQRYFDRRLEELGTQIEQR